MSTQEAFIDFFRHDRFETIILIDDKEAGTKPPSQTKEGLEFEFFLKFQSFYFA